MVFILDISHLSPFVLFVHPVYCVVTFMCDDVTLWLGVSSVPAEAVGQPGAVKSQCVVQLFPLGLWSSRMDAGVLLAFALAQPGGSLEGGGTEEEVGLTEEVAKALRLRGGLGVAPTVLDLAQGQEEVHTDIREGTEALIVPPICKTEHRHLLANTQTSHYTKMSPEGF